MTEFTKDEGGDCRAVHTRGFDIVLCYSKIEIKPYIIYL
jgi:hypothetical protein